MKTCGYKENGASVCVREIPDQYFLCPEHARIVRAKQQADETKHGNEQVPPPPLPGLETPRSSPKPWNPDPWVDALLKLNSNAGYLVKELQEINNNAESISHCLKVLSDDVAGELRELRHNINDLTLTLAAAQQPKKKKETP